VVSIIAVFDDNAAGGIVFFPSAAAALSLFILSYFQRLQVLPSGPLKRSAMTSADINQTPCRKCR